MSAGTATEMAIEVRTLASDADLPDRGRPEFIQVWRVSQSSMAAELDLFRSLLSSDEARRAERFRFEKDRNQFTIARGMLRTLLGRYVDTDPRALQFRFSDKGKPSLDGSDVQFNVAHSGDLILLAFAPGSRLGVDVEQIRRDFATEDIAERFFSEQERQCLRDTPIGDRPDAFFRCWTRKEAYIKATGDGLSLPLQQFDVSFGADQPAQLLATRPDPIEAQRWHMYNLSVDKGYAAALVVERRP